MASQNLAAHPDGTTGVALVAQVCKPVPFSLATASALWFLIWGNSSPLRRLLRRNENTYLFLSWDTQAHSCIRIFGTDWLLVYLKNLQEAPLAARRQNLCSIFRDIVVHG